MDSERPPIAPSLVEGWTEVFSNLLTEKAQLSQSLPNWIKGVNLSPTIGSFNVQCSRFKAFKTFKSFKRRRAIGCVLPISFYDKLKQLAKMKGTGL
jgi:hypothetical protein